MVGCIKAMNWPYNMALLPERWPAQRFIHGSVRRAATLHISRLTSASAVLDHPIVKELEPALLSVYIRELYNLGTAVKTKCEGIFEKTPPVPSRPNRYISHAPEIHALITGVLIDAANIKKLVVTPSARGSKESRPQYDLRRYRAALVRDAIGSVQLKEILDQKVRNTLEHFDEYMDEAVLELSDPKKRSSPWAAFNLIISGRDVFQPEIHPIKLYIAEERVFSNFKWSINIGRIYEEAAALVAVLIKHPSIAGQEGPGGMLFTFKGAPRIG
jgi:hypothetical protein